MPVTGVRKSGNDADSYTPCSYVHCEEKAFEKQYSSTLNECISTSDTVQKERQQDPSYFPRPATAEEIEELPHIMAKVPTSVWLLIFIGSTVAFARYGTSTPFQNYIQNPPGNSSPPGALGLGESRATIITNIYQAFVFLTPLPMGILSDVRLGRYRTMLLSLALMLVGYAVLIVTALPVSLRHGAGLGGLIASMLLFGFGQGGFSGVAFGLIGDQIPQTELVVIKNSKDQLVVVDRKITIQFVFNTYFWATNIGSLSEIATTLLERVSFWPAFLLAASVLIVSVLPIVLWSSHIVKFAPEGNVLSKAMQVGWIACRNHLHLSAAEPEQQLPRKVPWDLKFVGEIRRGLRACQVMILFVVFWFCYTQRYSNIISQAGQMELVGLSNDTMAAINVVAVVILSPIIQGLIRLLQQYKISFGPIRRITIAFLLVAMAMGYTAGLQKLIYSRGPCYSYPLECPAAYKDGHRRPNEVNVWKQTPTQVLLAAAEILGYVSMSEYAYSEAPPNMKALAQALAQLTVAIGTALGAALGPVSKNPWLVILYSCLAGSMGLTTAIFWLIFRRCDETYGKAADAVMTSDHDDRSNV